MERGEIEAAVESYRQAAALKPEEPQYANSLGHVLLLAGRYGDAEEWMRRALSVEPRYAEAYANLGYLSSLQQKAGPVVEEYYRRAIALKPDLAQAHVNLSHCLLCRGAFCEGWVEHEWRWRWEQFPSPKRNFRQPQWKGEPIRGARILLHAEQGFGDTIQFLRYVPLVEEQGARIVLEVHPELQRLVAGTFDGVEVIARGEVLPEFTWHCPLLSLPLAFGTEVESIPGVVPYLRCNALRCKGEGSSWVREKGGVGLRVGVVWAGGAINVVDRERSLSLAALRPLWQVDGVSFYSLQRGPVSVEADTGGLRFAGVQPQTGDFAETAAAICDLDLIVTVDTSVAHLAGALGKPVWILLPVRPDWRWMMERKDSPWYPSARLFRQTVEGEWSEVIAEVAAELACAVTI